MMGHIKLNKFVIIWEPKSGKSRLLDEIVDKVPHAYGFVTKEVAEGGARVGFEFCGYDGTRFPLAHRSIQSSFRVGGYGVDLDAIDTHIGRYTHFTPHNTLYLDEIAKMQLASAPYKELVRTYIEADNPLIATMCTNYRDSTIESINQNPRVIMFNLRHGNYESTKRELLLRLRHLWELC